MTAKNREGSNNHKSQVKDEKNVGAIKTGLMTDVISAALGDEKDE